MMRGRIYGGIVGGAMVAAVAWPVWAQDRPPTDEQLIAQRLAALSAQIEYAQMLITRLNVDLKGSEARGKWAARKLWRLPDEPAVEAK